jgi:hypothetical protein
MPTNPNKAFTEKRHPVPIWKDNDLPAKDVQKSVLLNIIHSKSISWSELCILALGYNKPLFKMTRGEVRACTFKANVWDNLRRRGDVS